MRGEADIDRETLPGATVINVSERRYRAAVTLIVDATVLMLERLP